MFKKTILSLLLIYTGPLLANVCPSDCNSCSGPCNDLSGLFFGAQGLYWTACQDNLEYASDLGDEDGFLVGPGKTHSLHYNWNGGVRGWFGLHCDGGEGRFVYTWIRNKAKGSETADGNNSLSAILIHPASGTFNALEAEGENEFEYQTFDLLFGNNIAFCCNTIWIRPYYGARGLKILQEFKTTYEGLDFDVPNQVKVTSKLEAAGLNAGFDFLYDVLEYLGIYGGFGGSVLAGRIDAHQRQYILGDDVQTVVSLDDDLRVCVPGYHLNAGLSWHVYCHNYCDFLLTIGYEFSHWYHVPTPRRFFDDVNHGVSDSVTKGQLTLHGATLSMLLSF